MADSIFDVLSSSEQIASNYEKYRDRFSDANAEIVNSETFLNLLVAEMTNQDPLEPTSNTEFVTQMAQFTSLQYAQDSSMYAQSNYAASLVGKTVTASKMDGGNLVTRTGVVDKVVKNGDNYTVTVDGVAFDLSKITEVSTTNTSNSTNATTSGNELGDQISRASMMIGMYATIQAKTQNGTALDSGIIDSIQVKNGEINAVINGIAYKLSDIVEVAYPTIEVPEEESGVTEVPAVEDEATEETGEVVTEEEEEDLTDLEELPEEEPDDPDDGIDSYEEFRRIVGWDTEA